MTLNIIIIFALVQLGYNLLFKPNYTKLCCGLFGAASDDASNININKIKILGIFNDSRGGHSCGMAIDGDIMIGVNTEKKFADFITKNNVDQPYALPVVLGHTRAATFGSHTIENAHPFGFGVNKDYYHFMGAHNGTLHNKDEIADLYDISATEEVPSQYNPKFNITRNKIDSEILLEIIYNRGYKVLEDYIGAAALSMYNTKKPTTLYLYHGKSKKLQSDELSVEERPLFYYQESPNVVYYSSIKESLEAINDTYGEVLELEHNYVYEIKNGNVAKAKKIKIDRSKAYQSNTVKHIATDYTNKEWDYKTRKWVEKTTPVLTTGTTVVTTKYKENLDNLFDHKLYFERTSKEFCKDNVYYENLRFYKDGTLLDGIYFLTKDQKLKYVSYLIDNVDVNYFNNPDDIKLKGDPIFFYFVSGMMLRSDKDYAPMRAMSIKHGIDYQRLSHCTIYPVKSLVDATYNKIYFRGNIADLKFTTFLGKNIISIRNGDCLTISEKDKDFEKNEKYYLPEDLELIEKITRNESLSESCELSSVIDTCEEEIIVELYNDNIMATIDYCKDDIVDSIKKEETKTDIMSKLEKIANFVSTTLNLKK